MKPLAVTSAAVEINQSPDARLTIDAAWLRDRLRAALAQLGRGVGRLDVMIVDDARMAQLHRDHCRMEGPTDVLTFPQSGIHEPIDADIAVCVDEAARRARELGHPVERELLLYIVHGLLHCAGFDDHDEAAYQRMHAEEDRILEAIGVGATFEPCHQPARKDREEPRA